MKECTYSLGDDYYVIGFAKDNTELRDKVNDAIKALVDNGNPSSADIAAAMSQLTQAMAATY